MKKTLEKNEVRIWTIQDRRVSDRVLGDRGVVTRKGNAWNEKCAAKALELSLGLCSNCRMAAWTTPCKVPEIRIEVWSNKSIIQYLRYRRVQAI